MCHKASAIGQKLTHLATLLLNQLQQEDASSGNNSDSAQQLHQDFDLMKIVDDVQSALRAGVSIQVRNFDGFFFTRAWQFNKSCHAHVKGGLFSESDIRFSNLQISKINYSKSLS